MILKPNIHRLVLELFNSKKWSYDSLNGDVNYFDQYCEMLKPYNEEEQKLIIELSKQFVHIPPEMYSQEVYELITKFANRYKVFKKVKVMPIINNSDDELRKVKSSNFVSYLMKNKEYSIAQNTKHLQFDIVTDLKTLGKKFNASHDKSLVLVDDFIGSGETAIECIERIMMTPFYTDKNNQESFINKDKVIILTIAISEEGYNKISGLGYDIIYNHMISKGITEFYSETERASKLRIMEGIESKLNLKDVDKFGRLKSEALISLIRTPNNTFPVFWKKSKVNKPVYPRRSGS